MDLADFLRTAGYFALFAIVFAESGLLVGLFLPGDSLLFGSGVVAAEGTLNIWALVPVFSVAATSGYAVGFVLGRRFGRRMFRRKKSRLFKEEHLVRTERFFQERGSGAILLARFIPIVRTLMPVAAGIGAMDYKRFTALNIAGGLLWTAGLTLAGYLLGRTFPGIEHYLLPIVAGIVVLSIAPTALSILKQRRQRP